MTPTEQARETLRSLASVLPKSTGIWPRLRYAPLADAIYWTDETPSEMTPEQDDLIRCLLRYRTSLSIGNPDHEWRDCWEEAFRQFPNWVGFLEDRVHPKESVLELYRRESEKFDKELEQLMSEE